MRTIFILAQAAIITVLAVFGAQGNTDETTTGAFAAPPVVEEQSL